MVHGGHSMTWQRFPTTQLLRSLDSPGSMVFSIGKVYWERIVTFLGVSVCAPPVRNRGANTRALRHTNEPSLSAHERMRGLETGLFRNLELIRDMVDDDSFNLLCGPAVMAEPLLAFCERAISKMRITSENLQPIGEHSDSIQNSLHCELARFYSGPQKLLLPTDVQSTSGEPALGWYSRTIMHDEVSETENIRKNLAIERMIVDGCELLLDVNQVFVRQGTLIQVICDKPRSSRSRLGNFGGSAREKKEAVRQVFLFTNHLLITARTNNGRLRLVKNYGKIALIECTLVEDTSASLLNADDDGPPLSEQTMGNVGRRSLEPFSPAARAPVPYSAPNNFATTPSKDSNSTTMVNMSGSQIGHKPPIRADSGPLTSGMASSRRITPSDNATRHSSGSALSSCPSGPTNRSWAGSTTGVPHRHSTSLCTAPTETDSGSRTGVGSTPDANVVNSLPTSSGFPNIPPVPLIHRLSSNFSMLSTSTATPINSSGNDKADYGNLDFRLIWEPKNGQPTSIWLVASTLQEKAAWCSDISQIRYATVDRLLDRLTDARFLSIDFLNTFLLTYRVFTTGLTVIWALKQVLANPEMEGAASTILLQNQPAQISINTSTLIYSPNVSQEGRSPSAFRFSDVAMPGRLPVLQEKLSLQEEDQLKDEESRPKTASQVPSTHSCLSELRLKAPIIKRRPFNLPSRPMSASESPNPASPEGTISASLLDSQRMSRSEINYGTEKDAKNSSGNLDATDLAGRPRTLSSCSSPPPLIPRSPIFSGIFNIRDDPPLQLPNLSELVGPTKRNSAKRESLPLSPLDNTTSDGVLSKGHTRLAPLASCELVTDDPEGTNTADRARDRSYSDVQNVDEAEEKAENVSNSESTRQRRRSHSAECFPVGFDRILLAESVCEGDSDKHIRIKSEDAWDSTDSQLSPNNENEPDPTSTPNPEIDTSRTNASRGIVATHKEFYDSLQSTERKLPCQVSQSDETHRLVENYLNQTIAPPCREHTNEGQKSTEPKVSSNTQHPASDRQADHNLPKNQSDASASLVVSSNPGIPVNLSPITEGLDLATKLIHEDRENKGACQTLAKSTMLAALRCPVGLVRIRQSEEKAQPKENPVVTMLNGNCTVHDTVQSSPSSPRNSHEPLSGQNRLTWNPAESPVCDVFRQLNVLHQAASCSSCYDIRDIAIHVYTCIYRRIFSNLMSSTLRIYMYRDISNIVATGT
ncbi:Ras-specific guanine nucleotide-releasing factor 2 [Clonorchis sinensis]|uniref:Ras-specific guanine nucleotide-releasing factor 2 n=1 Tax=Clonorchis sinensis TaxID=79923 RepID=A0A8T1LSP2_CLOSI|nr:Ras-specific guanine nucleotide-releasing factor 2 [Clonorchis sinensis]